MKDDTARLGLRNTSALLSLFSGDTPVTEEELAALATDDSTLDLESVASTPSAPAHLLRALSRTSEGMVRMRVAENPSIPEDVLLALAEDGDPEVRARVAANPSMPRDELRRLAQDGDWRVRRAVAGNPSTPVETLLLLAETEGSLLDRLAGEMGITPEEVLLVTGGWIFDTLEALAANPSTPVDALRGAEGSSLFSDEHLARFSNDSDELRRIAGGPHSYYLSLLVADNPSTPRDVLAELAQDWDSLVRGSVARNPSTPRDVLEELTEDDEDYVRDAAREGIERLARRGRKPAARPRQSRVAAEDVEPILPPCATPASEDALLALAADSDHEARVRVAANPSTSAGVLRSLAEDGDWRVRLSVAERRDVPADVLSDLAKDSSIHVRNEVAHNPSVPSEALAELARDCLAIHTAFWGHSQASADLWLNLSPNVTSPVLLSVAGNPNASEEVLRRVAAQCGDEVVHEAIIVCHPEAKDVVRDLVERDSDFIRTRAAESLAADEDAG